jgi:hypothetical protein
VLGYAKVKCCGVKDKWLSDRAVIGAKNRREKARKGMAASEMRGRIGVAGKSS